MRKGILWVLAALLAGDTLAHAQQTTPAAPKGITSDRTSLPPAQPSGASQTPAVVSGASPSSAILSQPSRLSSDVAGCFNCDSQTPLRAWFNADYLLWWVKNGPTNTPLVTTGSPTDPIPGALGQPNTRVLYGDGSLNYGPLSGVRLGGGIPINEALAVEGNYFILQHGATHFNAASDANGNPLIARPFFNAAAGVQDALLTSNPNTANGGAYFGNTFVNSVTQLQGWELNLTSLSTRTDGWNFQSLVGFRALTLDESLGIISTVTPLTAGNLIVGPFPTDPPGYQTDIDRFRTSNHFYGGQVGGRALWQEGNFSLTVTGKIALGVNQQVATVDGYSTNFVPGAAPVNVPGGLYAQPTNIGRYYHSNFSVVPEAAFNFGYNITPRIKATLGYTFLYWSQVARPGNQIDTRVNPSLVPTGAFGIGGGPPNQPAFHFQESGFWAQGLNVGLQFRF